MTLVMLKRSIWWSAQLSTGGFLMLAGMRLEIDGVEQGGLGSKVGNSAATIGSCGLVASEEEVDSTENLGATFTQVQQPLGEGVGRLLKI